MNSFKYLVMTLCLLSTIVLPMTVLASNDKASNAVNVIEQVKKQLSTVVWNLSSASEHWGYDVKTELVNSHSKNQRTQRFDPNQPGAQQWQLLLQDNKQPDDEVLAEYAKVREQIESEEQTITFDEQRLVDKSSLKLNREEANHWVISFNPNLQAFDAKTNARLAGLLWLNKTSGKLDKLFIKNTKKLTPSVSISISKYQMTIDLIQHDKATLVGQTKSIKKGSMFIFKDFDETMTATYSDYRFVE
jgi:hypothetical protein